MDKATGTQDGERIYSAHYLRLRDEWRLGLLTQCDDKKGGDLLGRLFQSENHILVGGQQRACAVELLANSPGNLPCGRTAFVADADGKCRVKWVLLSPTVWPEIPDKSRDGRPMRPHPGGWLPNWVSDDGKVELVYRTGVVRREYKDNRASRKSEHREPIAARLVGAVVPKAIPVTGYWLPHQDTGNAGGAKPTHLAVPAGAVYYFETSDADGLTAARHAANLAAVLNWHGAPDLAGQPDLTRIRNRRATLFGEKGFGLGVCGTWTPLAT